MEVKCLALKDLTSPRKGFTQEDEGHGDQKENIYAERRRSTPLKSAETSGPVFALTRKGAPPDMVHVTPIKHTPLAEPWTPTANLKMLISAAGPDIRDREMRKMLFRPIENEEPESPDALVEDTEVEDSCQFEAGDEEDDDTEKKPSRKQKSLGLLCQKFLALYPDYPHCPIWISLDEVSTSLGVERRRIYDIVNVLESLVLVGRIAKNSYSWYGRLRLEATLAELQRRGRQQGYHLQMDPATEGRGARAGREDDRAEGDGVSACGNRKDKSLRIMSQKFVMLFLVSKTQTVTLDAAAKILIEESQDSSSHSKYKTKVRRLYDIANVLTSLRLIKKVHVREERGRKPAFKWLGPVEFKSSASAAAGNGVNGAAVTLPEATQTKPGADLGGAKMARHASFNVTPTPVGAQRLVSSAPSSPRRDVTGLPSQPVDYSKKTPGNSAVCRLQFGSSTDNRPVCSSGSPLPPSSTRAVPRAPHQEHVFGAASSSSSSHCLAYLSQPSVVMLYRAPDTPEGPRSPGAESDEGRKRRRDEGEEEGMEFKKQRAPGFLGCEEGSAEPHREAAEASPAGHTGTSPSRPAGLGGEQSHGGSSIEPPQPSHYLYVPNNAGLNNLNFLFSAGQSPTGLARPPAGVPTLVPYVLMPSAALSHYRLQQQGSEACNKLSFSLPAAVMSPAHFMVGAAPYGLAAAASEINGSAPSTQDKSRLYSSVTGAPHSPSGLHQTARIHTPEPLTPHTPKETAPSASKAFFQTPGTLGSVVSSAPAGRKRGSAQRRLDVGRPPTDQLDV